MIRTSEEVKADFMRKGLSVSAWAIKNGFPPNLVYDVIAGRRPNPTRGTTHKIAVRLGLKVGEVVDDREIAQAI